MKMRKKPAATVDVQLKSSNKLSFYLNSYSSLNVPSSAALETFVAKAPSPKILLHRFKRILAGGSDAYHNSRRVSGFQQQPQQHHHHLTTCTIQEKLSDVIKKWVLASLGEYGQIEILLVDDGKTPESALS